MSGTDAAATLTLEINTLPAQTALDALEKRMDGLGVRTSTTQTPKAITSIGESADIAGAQLKTLSAHVAALQAKIDAMSTGGKSGIFGNVTKAGYEIQGLFGKVDHSIERTDSNLRTMLKSAEMAGAAAVKQVQDLGRAKNLANSLELRVIAAEEAAKIKKAADDVSALGRAKNLANSLELRVIAAEEANKAKEAAKAVQDLGRAKNLANSIELRVIATEEANKAKEAAKAVQDLGRAKNQANSLELRVIATEEATRLKAAAKDAQDLAKWLSLTDKQRASATLQASKAVYGGGQQNVLPGVAGSSQALASAQAAGSVANAESALARLTVAHRALAPTVQQSTAAQLHWNTIAAEGHATARGLAGAVGALWLTYGSLVPLLAGAAIAGAFKSATTAGSEFAYQLTFVKALGGESADAISQIGAAALAMSKDSMHTPVEMANGLRILSQAGLNARDAMLALPTALDLATVGEMDMAQASVTLAGVMNAFNLQVTDMGHIGDVFAKAAALSQTSVVGMTEAMKTASVVAAQYGVGMGDAAGAITLLAKVNITGTSAGTALRNMLKELYAPTKQSADVMKQLGLEAADSQGNLRTFADIIYDLKGKLGEFDKISQTNILQKLFGERGAKEAIAMLSQTREQWDKLKDSIENSDGFINSVAAQLEMSTKGRFQQALNTMKANLIGAFDQSAGGVRNLADSLKELADSKEFTNAINSIVSAVSSLGSVLITVTPLLINLGEAFLIWKSFGFLVGTISAVGAAFTGLSTAIGIVASVSAFAGGGLSGLALGLKATSSAAGIAAGATGLGGIATVCATLFGPAGWIALGVAALGALGYAFYESTKGASAATAKSNEFVGALDREVKKIWENVGALRERNRLQREGVGSDEAGLNTLQRQYKETQLAAAGANERLRQSTYDSQKAGDGPLVTYTKTLGLKNEVAKLNADLSKSASLMDSGIYAQGRQTVEGMTGFIQTTRAKVLDIEAQNYKKADPRVKERTDELRRQLKEYEDVSGKFTDPQAARGLQAHLSGLLSDAQSSVFGSGDKKFEMPGKPKAGGGGGGGGGSSAAARDSYGADLAALKGYITAYESEYSLFVAETKKLHEEKNISEIQMIKANTEAKIQYLTAEMDVQAKVIARAGNEENHSKEATDAATLYETLKTKRQIAQTEGDAAVLKATTTFGEQKVGLERALAGKLESEREKALVVLKGSYAKLFEEATLNGDKSTVEELERWKKEFLKGADFKDLINGARLAMSETSSVIKEMEAQIANDGGWIARVTGFNGIQEYIDQQLPAIRAKMEAAKKLMDDVPAGEQPSDAISKGYLSARKDFDAFVNYINPVWKDTVKYIDSTFHEGFSSMFQKGKTDWKAFAKSIADQLKTTLLDTIYQVFVRKYVMNVVANVAGLFGVSGLEKAAGAAGNGQTGTDGLSGFTGSAQNYGSAVNGVSSLFNTGSMIAGGYGALPGATAAANVAGAFGGDAIGTLAALSPHWTAATAEGISAASVAAGEGVAGAGAAAAEGVAVAGAAAAEGIGAIAAAAVPVVGWVVAAGALLYSVFGKSKAAPSQGAAAYSNLSDGVISAPTTGTAIADKYSAAYQPSLDAINKSFLGAFDSLGKALNSPQNVQIATSAMARGDGKQFSSIGVNGKQQYMASYDKDDKEAMSKMASRALGEALANAIQDSTFSVAIRALFAGMTDATQTVAMVQNITALTAAQKELNNVWGLSIDQAADVARTMSDGTDAGKTAAVALVAQAATAQKTISASLIESYTALSSKYSALLNAALPTNLTEYDAALKGVNKTTEDGVKVFSSLFSMRGEFAAFATAIEGVKQKVGEAADGLRTPEQQLGIRQSALQKSLVDAGIGSISTEMMQSISTTAAGADTARAALVKVADGIDYTTESGLRLAMLLPGVVAAFQSVAEAAATTRATIAEEVASAKAATEEINALYRSIDQARIDISGAERKALVSDRRIAQAPPVVDGEADASEEAAKKTAKDLAPVTTKAATQITEALIRATREGVVDRLGLSASIAGLIGDAIRIVADDEIYATYADKGPGLGRVTRANERLRAAGRSDYVGGEQVIGDNQIALARGMDSLTRAFGAGNIAVGEYEKGINTLHSLLGEPIDINAGRLGIGAAAADLAKAGQEAIGYYFGQITTEVEKLAAAAAEASTPLTQTVDAIGKMQSMAVAFSQSANAVASGAYDMIAAGQAVLASGTASDAASGSARGLISSGSGILDSARREGSQYRAATLVGSAARIAAEVLTTQSAAEAAKRLAKTAAFEGSTAAQIRDASLLLDGIKAFDAESLQGAFLKLSHALDTRKITEAQYVEAFNVGIATFTDQLDDTSSAFGRLREASRSLADALLVGDLTTLSPGAKAAEARRQYDETIAAARGGDENATGRLEEVSRTLLDASKASASSALEYASTFGLLIRDLRDLESSAANSLASGTPKLKIPAFASGGSYAGGMALVGESGPELINFNSPGHIYSASQTSGINAKLENEIRALHKELARLRADTNTANAAITAASRRTYKALEKWDADGLPATTT